MYVAILSLMNSLFFASAAMASTCQFESNPTVLESGQTHLLQYWEFQDQSKTDAVSLPQSSVLENYRSAIKAAMDTNPFELLKRYLSTDPNESDAINIKLVQNRLIGRIRPAHCVELLLLDNQLKRNPAMLAAPTEFLAFFLRGRSGHIRAYYLTNDIDGVRDMRGLIAHATADIQDGWTLIANLHNHSFFINHLSPSDKFHPQGVLAPSANDAQVFQSQKIELKLPRAMITNGFDTLEVDDHDFSSLRGNNQ